MIWFPLSSDSASSGRVGRHADSRSRGAPADGRGVAGSQVPIYPPKHHRNMCCELPVISTVQNKTCLFFPLMKYLYMLCFRSSLSRILSIVNLSCLRSIALLGARFSRYLDFLVCIMAHDHCLHNHARIYSVTLILTYFAFSSSPSLVDIVYPPLIPGSAIPGQQAAVSAAECSHLAR